jgi:Regulator of chromosome condensation (RCC1) repeat
VTGRPHDFAALLRLQRLPRRLRHYAVHQTYRSVQVAGQRDEQNGPNQTASLFNPTDWVDRLVTYFSDMVYNNASSASTSSRTRNTTMDPTDWDVAKQLSFLATPTVVDMPLDDNDGMTTMNPTNVVCSAGLTAISTESGTVYCMGLNGMGQCGVGYTSNNVWTPSARVTGLSRDFAYSGQRRDLVQSYPIQQVALGLQRTCTLIVTEYRQRFGTKMRMRPLTVNSFLRSNISLSLSGALLLVAFSSLQKQTTQTGWH